jgi:hypothetical protein
MAGAGGFEPPHGGIKIRCLTAWLRNGDLMHELAAQFLALAEKQAATAPLMIGHRLMGTTLLQTGDIADALVHLDRAIALYDPAAHRPLATRFGRDVKVVILCWRALALWLFGRRGR